MIYLKCECGNGLGVPGSFVNEPVRCDDCGRSLRLVAAHDLSDRQAANWRLEVVSAPRGLMQGEHVLLGGTAPIDVGSGEGKHLRLTGKFVSGDHCRLVRADDGWIVEDVAGSNGVFVNAERVSSAALRPGDVLRIGGYELRYAPAGRSAPVAPPPRSARVPPPPPPPPPEPTPTPEEALPEVPTENDVAENRFEYAPAQAPSPQSPPGPPCPCCRRTLGAGARICVDCGIDVRTGRPLLTAQGLDEDTLHERAEVTARYISWVIPLGLYPIGSEARGHAKPYAVWAIAFVTVLTSFVFLGFLWSTPDSQLPAGADLMFWSGDRELAAERSADLLAKVEQAEQAGEIDPADAAELRMIAERPTLPFRPHQLLTHALLHGGILHLAGNLLFLLVLGTRINALLGNLLTALLYPLLAVAGAVAVLVTSRGEPAGPGIGASGAIMGLAGMYLVLFPTYRLHMVAWVRLLFFVYGATCFAIRGFWVVLFFIGLDVVASITRPDNGVGYWAHLGGFAAGVIAALVLLLTRTVHAHGGDILSVALGKRAWALLGRPQPYRRAAPTAPSEVTSPAA